jgi:hypothetical protein
VVEGKSRRQRRAASRCPAAHGGSSAGTFCDGVSDVSFLEGEVFSTVSPLTLMGWHTTTTHSDPIEAIKDASPPPPAVKPPSTLLLRRRRPT